LEAKERKEQIMANNPTGRFVWFEYSSSDARKAQGFYGELFGWKTKEITAAQQPYTMIVVGEDSIGGYWPAAPGQAPQHAQWISHLQVDNAAESAAKVKSLGGQVKMEPMKVGDHGTFAVVQDPTGAVFSLWQAGIQKGNAEYKGKPGYWVWNELVTDDPAKAIAFYKALAGFEDEAMSMGEEGTYHILKSDGAGRAGVMKTPMPGVPTQWMPYVQVADPDQIAARASKLGASVKVQPTDIPNVGRYAVFVDPLGAALGILRPMPR
jgi:predicted enzyme related to lactoylglutathione lyase